MIAAVLFDLDDTLYLQAQWLSGAWQAVAALAGIASPGVNPARLHEALVRIASLGSDRGRIIDRALAECGYSDVSVSELVEAFRTHAPSHLEPLPGVVDGLACLRTRVPVGLVTDGDPRIQRAKLHALGLIEAFDVVVISDEKGREFRKPHPSPFLRAVAALRVDPGSTVYIGDRPDKDIEGAGRAGMRAIRVLTGECAHLPDTYPPWKTARDVIEAFDVVASELLMQGVVRPTLQFTE